MIAGFGFIFLVFAEIYKFFKRRCVVVTSTTTIPLVNLLFLHAMMMIAVKMRDDVAGW